MDSLYMETWELTAYVGILDRKFRFWSVNLISKYSFWPEGQKDLVQKINLGV